MARKMLELDLTNCPLEVIQSLVMYDDLNVNELQLFSTCVEWAVKRCRQQGLPLFPYNLRQVMLPFLFFIRFPCMTYQKFNSGPRGSGILTEKEEIEILMMIKLEASVACPFVSVPRTKPRRLKRC